MRSMSRLPKRFGSLLISLVLLGLAPAPSLADVYHWQDADGRLVFSDQPVADRPGLVQLAYAPRELATPPRARRGTAVPFQRAEGLMLVRVRLNDRVEAPFFIDTAASGVSLPTSVAKALGGGLEQVGRATVQTAGGQRELGVVRLDTIELQGLRVSGVAGTVNPELEIGLLGASFLRHFNYLVDNAGGVIVFEQVAR